MSQWLELPYLKCFEKKKIEWNDRISNENLQFFRTEAVEDSDVIMSVEVLKTTEVFRTTLTFGINKLIAKITFLVKFCHHSELRLWRTGMLLLTKSKGQ